MIRIEEKEPGVVYAYWEGGVMCAVREEGTNPLDTGGEGFICVCAQDSLGNFYNNDALSGRTDNIPQPLCVVGSNYMEHYLYLLDLKDRFPEYFKEEPKTFLEKVKQMLEEKLSNETIR